MNKRKHGYFKLKIVLMEKGLTQNKVANELGIDRSTFNCKLNRKGADFSLEEVRKLRTLYGIKPDIFFAD